VLNDRKCSISRSICKKQTFGGRALPAHAEGAYSAPSGPWLDLGGRTQSWGRKERVTGWQKGNKWRIRAKEGGRCGKGMGSGQGKGREERERRQRPQRVILTNSNVSLSGSSLLYVLSSSMSNDQVYHELEFFSERLQCSRVSEPVMSPSVVALTDTEPSDTATESADGHGY